MMSVSWNNAIWLATRSLRESWSAVVLTAVYFAFMGLVLANDTSSAIEFAHPVLMLILIQPAISARYMSWKSDNEVVRNQMFLRSLPVGFGTIIVSRLIVMLIAGIVNIPLYFFSFWYVDQGWPGFENFLAWSIFWIGIAIGCAGLSLIQEFRLSIKRWTTMNFIVIMVVGVVALLIFLFTEIRPVQKSVEVASTHPWILAASGLVIGIAALTYSIGVAVRSFRKREFAL